MADERSREDHGADTLALGTADSLPHQPDRRSPGVPEPTGMGFRPPNVLLTVTVDKYAGICHCCIFDVNAS
jgi:hypothetical protein